jgi:hypothetical protein
MSCLTALPPQVQPLMLTLCGDVPCRSNHPPQTKKCLSPRAQSVYREFRVVTMTRSPERKSRFRTSSSERAWLMMASSVWAMAAKFQPPIWMLDRFRPTSQREAGTGAERYQKAGYAGGYPATMRRERYNQPCGPLSSWAPSFSRMRRRQTLCPVKWGSRFIFGWPFLMKKVYSWRSRHLSFGCPPETTSEVAAQGICI